MNLNREQTLILLCTNLNLSRDASLKIARLLIEDLDYQFIVSEAKRQGVAELVYANISGFSEKNTYPPDSCPNSNKHIGIHSIEISRYSIRSRKY